MLKKLFKNLGPGPLIAAAFIGPGTVTLCTLAGVKFGMSLLWTLLIAVLASITLQSMAVKIGIIGKKSITEALKDEISNPVIKYIIITLIFMTILIGNTAYEAGNISGAVMGLETLFGQIKIDFKDFSLNIHAIIIGLLAGALLWIGKYRIIERCLIGLVIIMSITFLFTAIATRPSLLSVLSGLFSFKAPAGSLLTIIGLVGTTIVPYNLFLHAELVKEKWNDKGDLKFALKDLIIALGLGGLISLSIVITASSIKATDINTVGDLALGLESVFGTFSRQFLAIGLFAAGITSTITAPLAAAYVVCGCFGLSTNLQSNYFKFIWLSIILFGVFFSATGLKLITIIQFAQITNGVLLPIMVGLLLWMVNKSSLLGNFKNNNLQNAIGFIIIVVSLFLSLRTLFLIFQ
ncbi:MAG: Nramp family divalent metal transporter [Flavobacteriaceae bacterium]|nr:Nramp family divalent metal transporter [Flavobacteriaceae bacterium]